MVCHVDFEFRMFNFEFMAVCHAERSEASVERSEASVEQATCSHKPRRTRRDPSFVRMTKIDNTFFLVCNKTIMLLIF